MGRVIGPTQSKGTDAPKTRRWFVGTLTFLLVLGGAMLAGLNYAPVEASAAVSVMHDRGAEGRVDAPYSWRDEGSPVTVLLSREPDASHLQSAYGDCRVDGVRANGFINATANVKSFGGVPLSGAKVVFTWHSAEETRVETRLSDSRGRASALRWTPAVEKDSPVVLTISASKDDWSGTSYCWYIPQ